MSSHKDIEQVRDELKTLVPWLKYDLNFGQYKHLFIESSQQILYFNDDIL